MWEPGDTAFCIKRGPWSRRYSDGAIGGKTDGPKFGDQCIVEDVNPETEDFPQARLFLKGWGIHEPGWTGFDGRKFIKIHPHQEDEEDRKTIRLLKGETVEGDLIRGADRIAPEWRKCV